MTEPGAGSPLTCFGVIDGTPIAPTYAARVYYVEANGQLNEMAWKNGWVNSTLPGTAGPGSVLTCFGYNGTDARAYYTDANGRLNEMAWKNGWVNSTLPGTGGALTCFGANGACVRRSHRCESAAQRDGVERRLGEQHAARHTAADDSALTCFGANGDARVYSTSMQISGSERDGVEKRLGEQHAAQHRSPERTRPSTDLFRRE